MEAYRLKCIQYFKLFSLFDNLERVTAELRGRSPSSERGHFGYERESQKREVEDEVRNDSEQWDLTLAHKRQIL